MTGSLLLAWDGLVLAPQKHSQKPPLHALGGLGRVGTFRRKTVLSPLGEARLGAQLWVSLLAAARNILPGKKEGEGRRGKEGRRGRWGEGQPLPGEMRLALGGSESLREGVCGAFSHQP